MREIKLTRGQVALVDKEDYDDLIKYKWQATPANTGFYAKRTEGSSPPRRSISMHRQILGVTSPDIQVDHINHNGLDNRRSNIRECTRSENMRNRRADRGSASKYVGIIFRKDRRKWVSYIIVDGKTIYGGHFSCETEAAKSRDELSRKYYGEFAYVNIKQ